MTGAHAAWVAAGALSLALAALAAYAFAGSRTPAQPLLQLDVPLPPGLTINSSSAAALALSPDGRTLAYVGTLNGTSMMWLRPLDARDSAPIAGSEGAGAFAPFWSPDSLSIGFFADGKLKRADVHGGPPQTLCDAPAPRGGTWNRDGVILIGSNVGPLMRIAATGGQPTPATTLDATVHESSHRWPQFLPDGRHFLLLTRRSTFEETGVYVGSLESGTLTQVIPSTLSALYGSGHLLFLRDGTLMAQPFDSTSLTLTGEPRTIAEQVSYGAGLGRAAVSVSDTGVLAYSRGANSATELVWTDRTGRRLGVLGTGPRTVQASLALSKDGTQLALSRMDPKRGEFDLWQVEVGRDAPLRLTSQTGNEVSPVWSPDGRRIAYALGVGASGIFVRDLANPSGKDVALVAGRGVVVPNDWSPDGKRIIYEAPGAEGKPDLLVAPVAGGTAATPLLATVFSERQAQFSPDGAWVAYASDESGVSEVYVCRSSDCGGKRRISSSGGFQPRWRGDGRELFYLAADRTLMAVEVTLGRAVAAASPRALFRANIFSALPFGFNYAVTGDGQKFLIDTELNLEMTQPVSVIINWTRRTP